MSDRLVKLILLRKLKVEDDLVISFWISKANFKSFEALLLQYLTFCANASAVIDVTQTNDLETGKPHLLLIRISGDKYKLAMAIKEQAQKFKDCCDRIE
jgi:hypothetical protein